MNDTQDSDSSSRAWSYRRQEAGVIVWSSFLAACLATMVFFAYFDPLLLANDENPPAWLASRMGGYAVGFFFFWIVTSFASFLTAYLLDTAPHNKSSTARAADHEHGR